MPSSHRIFTMEERKYLDMYNIVPTHFIDYWKNNHPTAHDPFGIRAPEEHEQIAISKAYEDRRRPVNGIRGEQGSRIALTGRTTATGTAIRDGPITYNDLVRTQQTLMGDHIDNRGTTRKNKYDLNRDFRMYLKEHFPEEEAFLHKLGNELNMDPIYTIIECIRVAMSTRATDANVLNDINYELMNLEKEKGNGKHQKMQ